VRRRRMPAADREFREKLLATFREEAAEHLGAISRGLIDLENAPVAEGRAPVIEKMFREAHSLKGASRAVNLKEIETVCQSLEGVFSRAKRGEVELNPEALDVMHEATDEIERLLQSTRGESAPGGTAWGSDLNGRLEAIRGNALPPDQSPRTPADAGVPGPAAGRPSAARTLAERPSADETVRVPADMLDRLLLQVEELVPASMAVAHRSAELHELSRESSEWKREWGKVRLAARSVRESMDRDGAVPEKHFPGERKLLDFLEWNEEFVRRMETRLNALARSSARDQRSLGTMVDSLLQDTKVLLLRPFASLTEAYPKLVRDLCRQQGKDAALVIRGSEIEIDRRILQEIKDPLLHLLRNCVDHGIEKAEERVRMGKSPRGAIVIAIEQKSANRVEISISDDGAGIDPQKVREAAVKSGHVDAASAQGIGDSEILSFIFLSGVTTSPIVTDISGRGLGMTIVREKVERLGGDVSLDNRPGAGTTFRLLLPLTVSTVRGLLVRVGEQSFVIPVVFVERVALTRLDSVQSVENRATVLLGERLVSFVRLRDVLEIPVDLSADNGAKSKPMVVLAASERRIACQVDEIIGEQELLVKTLGPQLVRVRNIAGAAVLGTGKVVPILNVADLMKSAVKTSYQSAPARVPEKPEAPRQRAILVVDDSITARTLLKTILESAGYFVRTAVDGAEAFATLRELEFDVVVSDVDMPRLNGFDLTAKIRADRKLADLPVILVTALESRQDRERGIDVGANAYIVKSSFEQSNLIDVVHRYARL
jgi:two-component system, chemotaxis family, sensor kinase CheA